MFDGPDVDAEIVLVGRSNVGKTTLMRELTGHDFASGRRPGVTREPNSYDWNDFAVTDLPGYGFMEGVPEQRQEEIKDGIVEYIERNRGRILLAVHVVDANSFVEVVDRWSERGEVPHDVDLHALLHDLDIPAAVAVNKIDKAGDRDATLDEVAERLGYPPPWRQWSDVVAPTNAKNGSIEPLLEVVRERLKEEKRHDLLKHFS